MKSSASASKKFFGIFTRKERWGLSWRGWLILASLGFLSGTLLLLNVQPFLAETHRVNTNLLVVEGWIHDYAIRASVEEFKAGPYQRIFTTGGPVVGSGGYINDYNTSASVGADLLRGAGVPAESVQMVPSHVIGRDRTYNAAVALREWFRVHNVPVQSLNVITEDVHARRSQLLFAKAFGPQISVGVIAVPHPDYDPSHWWRYSEGVKDVLSEGVAYIYAKFFFYPSKAPDHERAAGTSQASQ
jgi:uncharacterized SAM-binding protein YcdF (DUF218 family)